MNGGLQKTGWSVVLILEDTDLGYVVRNSNTHCVNQAEI